MSLKLEAPKLRVRAPVLAVGLTTQGVMEAPSAPAGDPVWQKVFWYRGGGVPGDSGTATIGGHVTDMVGKPAEYRRPKDLKPGDEVRLVDRLSGAAVTFRVLEVAIYTVQQTRDPAVLTRIYGPGPVAGTGPQPSPDGISYLTLFTCEGEFVDGQFDHRLVVYAQRV